MIDDGQVIQQLPVSDGKASRLAFLRLAFQERSTVSCILALYLVAAGGGVAIPIALGEVIDGVAEGWTATQVDLLCALLLIAVVCQLLASRFGQRLSHRYGERCASSLRERTMERALRLPLTVVERAGIADLLTRTAGDVAAVSNVLRQTGPGVVAAGLELVVLVAAVAVVSPLLAMLIVPVVPFLVVVSRRYAKRAAPVFARERAAMAEIAEIVSATESGGLTVAAHRLGESREAAGAAAITGHWQRVRQIVGLQSWFMPALDIAQIVPVIAILWVGGLWAGAGYVTVGAVVACGMLTYRVAGPLERIMYSLTDLQSASAALARIEGIGLVPSESRGGRTAASGIALDHVVFGYESGPEVLRVDELRIPEGTHVVVVGGSGSGKSTLARLIAGIERPRSGSATIGGVVAADLEPECLRRRAVLLTQENHVFAATLRENLALGAGEPDDDSLWEALGRVGASWARSLAEGLDTVLETGELRLTAAQRQQLALARALVADADIVIFDESFAALDAHSKGDLEGSVFTLLRERTVIVVAHQLDFVSDETRIVVVADGEIVEDGVHAELVVADGTYASLWDSWKAGHGNE
ncbi:ABC transporter ATP-binding protein [Brachybacterium sp. DNPG3]